MLEQYDNRTMAKECLSAVRSMTMREKLESKKQRLEQELVLINAALDALSANPEIDKALDALSKVGNLI